MNPPVEPILNDKTYRPCGAPGCPRQDGRLYPGGRFCADHRPGMPAQAS